MCSVVKIGIINAAYNNQTSILHFIHNQYGKLSHGGEAYH